MPLEGYGLLTAAAVDRRREGSGDSPHYQVHARADDGTDYRIAINVKSQQAPSDLLYLLDDDFQHPVTAAVEGLGPGWHALAPGPGGANLDFVRANLFDPAKMRPLPPDVAGPDNDLPDLLDHFVQRAIEDPASRLHVFGQRWGPEPDKADKVFGFVPGNGVHDVHLNQGNSGQFARDDGVWQDGGLLIEFPAESRWVGVFLAFQSQAWHTDDVTGHAIGGAPAPEEPAIVQVVAALVNPVGPAPEAERILLLNASPSPVDLTGWRLADRQKVSCPVPAGPLAAGATLEVQPSEGMQLGNRGGAITLLDAAGLKVSGVSYTDEQAQREGWTIVF
ncbi:MAG TPA: DUF2278 family protein [Thermoleophilaceae bacterium]